jgi:hypothetical protein
MVPAMERLTETPARRNRVGLGLALAVGLVDLGCARLPWKKPAQDPPMLGRVSDTTDIYAMNRRAGDPPAAALAAATPASAPVDEVGMAYRPTETPPIPSTGGIALQPPAAIDPKPSSKPADGVPTASLVLASSERRTPGAAVVVAEARAALDAMTTYEVSVHRQERVNGTLLPEEDVVLAIRRDPRAVRLTWIDGPNQGREVLYRADEPGGSMHVKMANPALPRLTLPPESPLVMRNSRHPVTEAGLDSIVEGLENAVKAQDASGIRYAGLETANGLDQPQHCLIQDSLSGERWRVYLDPQTHLPSLVEAKDANGELLERYHFRKVRPNLPELASTNAFDPNARWGKPAGLLGRLTRGESAEPSTPR